MRINGFLYFVRKYTNMNHNYYTGFPVSFGLQIKIDPGTVGNFNRKDPVITGRRWEIKAWYGKILELPEFFSGNDR